METIHTTLGPGGRIVVPAAWRKHYGLNIGDEVTLIRDSLGVFVASPHYALERLQSLVAERLPASKHGSKDFIAKRKLEAKREH